MVALSNLRRLSCDSHVCLILVSTVSQMFLLKILRRNKSRHNWDMRKFWKKGIQNENGRETCEKHGRSLYCLAVISCKTPLQKCLTAQRLLFFIATEFFTFNGQDSRSRDRKQLNRWELNRSRKVPLAGIWTLAVWGAVVPSRRCATHKAMALTEVTLCSGY